MSRTTSSSAPCPPSPADDPPHPPRPKRSPPTARHGDHTPSGAAPSDWQTVSLVRHWAPSRWNSHELSTIVYRTAHHITRPRRVIPRRSRPSRCFVFRCDYAGTLASAGARIMQLVQPGCMSAGQGNCMEPGTQLPALRQKYRSPAGGRGSGSWSGSNKK
ncbi:hypothetical protein VF21_08384 [Pseudogymnoascus sp. 05NY08]|nr:hypothetical protein VF21_08384 [Pseudogymnoascus sp. 05NY08]